MHGKCLALVLVLILVLISGVFFGHPLYGLASDKPIATPAQEQAEVTKPGLPENNELKIFADSIKFDLHSKKILGQGNIKVLYQDISLTSDTIDFSLSEGTLLAEGNIRLSPDPRYEIKSDSLKFNPGLRLWSAENTQVMISPSYFFTAEQAKQVSQEQIIISKAYYTACDPDDPAWGISFSEGVIDPGRSAKLKNITFRIRNKPVFYFPYLRFPILMDKAAGFLIPDFGRSSNLGLFVKNYFYWPVREWTDFLFPIDYYEKRGVGTGLEYRYALTRHDRGYLQLYGVSDHRAEQNRGHFALSLQQTLSASTRGVADISVPSDRDFYKDFHQELSKRYSSFQESRAFVETVEQGEAVENITEPWNLRLLVDYTKPMGDAPRLNYSRMPRLDLATRLCSYPGWPIFFKWDSSFTYLKVDDQNLGQSRANRFDLGPEIFYNYTKSWYSLTPSFFYRQTHYLKDEPDETIVRDSYGGQIDLSGPGFFRLFKERINHTWYPQLKLIYNTVDQERDLIRVDALDFVPQTREAEFTLFNRVAEKGVSDRSKISEKSERGSYNQEWLEFRISQRYNLSYSTDIDSYSYQLQGPGWGDFELETSFQPTEKSKYTLNYIYSVDDHHFRSSEAEASFGVREVRFDLDLRCSHLEENQDLYFIRSAWQILLFIKWLAEINLYYDLENETIIENKYTLTYKGSCWSSQLAFVQRFDEQQWNVRIYLDSLGGLNF